MAFTRDTLVPRLVVVDDTDPTIRYSPSSAFSLDTTGSLNDLGYGGNVFNQTITGTTVNASFSYTFNGTFVRAMVAGSIEGPQAYGWNCSVDGHTITSFVGGVDPKQVTNYIACDSARTLERGKAGQHTLNVNFYFPGNTTGPSLWLDSIQYQPLPSDPLDDVTLRIDSSDPSVTYGNMSGGWTWQGDQSNGTQKTKTSMDFAFNGSSVTLYTVVLSSPSLFNANRAFYSLDGKPTFFDLPGSMIAASIGNYSDIYNYPLFTVSNLSISPHDIEVVTSYNSSTSPQYLAIDYFLIKTNPLNSSSPETAGNSSSSGTGSSSSSSSTPTSTPSHGFSHGSSHKNIGDIIGGAVAGVAGLGALFLLLLWLVRRQKGRKYSGTMLTHTGSSPSHRFRVTPFEYVSQLIPAGASKHREALAVQDEQDHRNEIRGPIRRSKIRRNEIRRHLDSGVRIPSADDVIVEIPPTYTQG
ncbi:hypothetical protein BDP27DRAFT_1358818 [Rhodocollybia butyracea]|uniref:Uncharacterized protein n=1 Tax=Rhodocollybia butyracea TaxID=206335 RepID=A0A9P5UDY0_9AGAR|nr:hypothetical protein BDP27DRAFT_1358818 [Rhodocollybia butyracea]